jgi:putative tryptophan/tyrosine transport system substrate-binding protein
MERRQFVRLLGSAAVSGPTVSWPVSWPASARAGQPGIPVVGWLAYGPFGPVDAFRQGLSEAGYVEGRNVAIEFRRARQLSLLPGLANDLVSREVAVIVANGSPSAALAAKAATSGIPIVFISPEDPRKYGLVTRLNRPEGNLTGINFRVAELAGKRLQLLSEIVPQTTTIAYLSGPPNSVVFENLRNDILAAARTLGRELLIVPVSPGDYDAAFNSIVELQAGALIVGDYTIFLTPPSRKKILELTARHNIPAIYPSGIFAEEGGLMSYGPNALDLFRRIGSDYVGQILKGAKPADLPVQQPNKFEFVINMKTVKAAGLTVPRILFAAATQVIE